MSRSTRNKSWRIVQMEKSWNVFRGEILTLKRKYVRLSAKIQRKTVEDETNLTSSGGILVRKKNAFRGVSVVRKRVSESFYPVKGEGKIKKRMKLPKEKLNFEFPTEIFAIFEGKWRSGEVPGRKNHQICNGYIYLGGKLTELNP